MAKGFSEVAEYMIQLVLVVFLIIFLSTLVISKINPLESAELEALRVSNQISIFLNSMSTVDQGKITINISNPVDVNIRYVGDFDKKRWDVFLNEIGQSEIKEGFQNAFTKKGYYVFVTPYRNGTQKPFELSFILSYPTERDASLEKIFEKPESLCIIKENGKERAEVSVCEN